MTTDQLFVSYKSTYEQIEALMSILRNVSMSEADVETVYSVFESFRSIANKNTEYRLLLQRIALPARGSKDEQMTLQGFADEINKTYTREELEGD